MAYQETEITGYGTRVKQSFKKIATGFTMFVGATVMQEDAAFFFAGDEFLQFILRGDPDLLRKMVHIVDQGTVAYDNALRNAGRAGGIEYIDRIRIDGLRQTLSYGLS